jgi:ketosteroid isomerase-like protein
MTRSPQQTLKAHIEALESSDMNRIMADYADDAVILTPDGSVEGHDAIEAFFTGALQMLPQPKFDLGPAVHHGDITLLRWTARSPAGKISDGVDTFVVRDGSIRVHTSSFTFEPS